MSDLKMPEFIPGPPGTGKTHKYLKNKYEEFLQEYSWERIVVLSHTNTAADEIVKAVKKLPKMENVSKKKLQEQICTIHSYFRAEYLPIDKYEKEDHDKFCKDNAEMRFWKGKWDKHPLYQFDSHAHGKELSYEQYWRMCDPESYKPYNLFTLKKLKIAYDKYRNNGKAKLSFEDMIDNFINDAEVPKDIDILIVDEAQDCSKPQIKALRKAATLTKKFIFIGDADQTIHEYAGSDPTFFYRLSSTEEAKANELTEGLRCGKTINEICKRIIYPVWKQWGDNAERTWTPREGITGRSLWIPSIEQSCIAKDKLVEKILNTDETFLFTYRGNPTHKHVNGFLQRIGIDYKLVSNEHPHVSRKHFKCFTSWNDFITNKVSRQQIIDYWPLLGKSVKVHGKGSVDNIKELIDKDYNIEDLIQQNFIIPEAKQYKDFSEVCVNKEENKKLIEKIPFIKKVLANGMDITKEPRVQHDTIHKVKGLTFDNVIVDLSVYRQENDRYEPIRLAYVAYSRGRNDCWTVGTSGPMSLAGIQNNRNYILWGDDDT